MPGGPSSPWFVVPERLDVIDSTNRYLADRAARGAPEGSSVVAGRQTAGRGRLNRQWVDVPGGSLLCSMLFRPAMEIARWHLISMLVALAGLDACADAAGVDARCKWPNDLVVEGRKVGGILAEVVVPPAFAPTGGAALVVGIGLNCNWGDAWDSAPLGAGSMATSLDRVAGRPVDREAVAARLLERVAQRYAALTDRPFAPAGDATAPDGGRGRSLTSEYRRKLDTIGRVVRVELADEVFTGRALDIDDGGRLLVDVGMCMRTVEAGDVVHVR
jgi:BirA family biotin operon repressor/biotin-[acetyl-CoA-carboxylase] ligase